MVVVLLCLFVVVFMWGCLCVFACCLCVVWCEWLMLIDVAWYCVLFGVVVYASLAFHVADGCCLDVCVVVCCGMMLRFADCVDRCNVVLNMHMCGCFSLCIIMFLLCVVALRFVLIWLFLYRVVAW